MKRIHRIMKSLINRLREVIKLIKITNKDATKSNQNKLLIFAKENIIRMNEILQLLNQEIQKLNESFSRIFARVIKYTSNKSTKEFEV